jgi:glycosyltransferase involved in cell wall biosynthesis
LLASVIIPHHNRIDHLSLVLRSLIQQSITLEKFEIIVVDDGSNGQKLDIEHPSMHILYSEHRGAAYARNRGMSIAKGEVFIFLDCDIIVSPLFIENHINFHKRFNHHLAIGLL